jgi:hypothetical protein
MVYDSRDENEKSDIYLGTWVSRCVGLVDVISFYLLPISRQEIQHDDELDVVVYTPNKILIIIIIYKLFNSKYVLCNLQAAGQSPKTHASTHRTLRTVSELLLRHHGSRRSPRFTSFLVLEEPNILKIYKARGYMEKKETQTITVF